MNVTYQTTFVAVCPVDDTTDIYQLTVVSDVTIEVERILAAITEATVAPAYQEEITERLAAVLQATATTVGTHSGVLTTVTA